MSDMEQSDTSFGRAAAEKEEKADELVDEGVDPTTVDGETAEDPRPRAGGKASEGAPPAAGQDDPQ